MTTKIPRSARSAWAVRTLTALAVLGLAVTVALLGSALFGGGHASAEATRWNFVQKLQTVGILGLKGLLLGLMTVSTLFFAAVAHADRGDPFPWTPSDRQFVAAVDEYTSHVHRIYDPSEADDANPKGYLTRQVTGFQLSTPVSMARNMCRVLDGGMTPKEFDERYWFIMPAWDNGVPEGAWVTKQAIRSYCRQYLSLEYW
jgi:hypothetical protein